MKYRAEFRKQGTVIRTRFYDTRDEAQEALARRIGWFHYLGKVAGDSSWPGKACESAPRNGGLVSIEER
jgi:hypothetical protein